MATERFRPDLLGPIILEMRDRFARIATRLDAIEVDWSIIRAS